MAQKGEEMLRNLHKNWRLGGIGGVSYHGLRIEKKFSASAMDMNSQPNPAFSFYVTKDRTKTSEQELKSEMLFLRL